MKDMTVETLNFIILCMGLLFVMAGIFLIVGKLAGKRPGVHCGRCAHDRMGASLRHPRIKIVDARTAPPTWNTYWRPCGRGSMATAGCLSTSSHCGSWAQSS